MVTVEQHHLLLDECKQWVTNLKEYKHDIAILRSELYIFAPGKTDHETLKQIEHYHNQFHIQSINIHDLKHEIKHHIQEAEHHPNFGHRIPHHNMKEKYDLLVKNLNNLKEEFHSFINT